MSLLLALQKVFYRVSGCHWSETQLPSGLAFAGIYTSKRKLIALYLVHLPGTYKKVSLADTRRSILIRCKQNIWPRIAEFAGLRDVKILPPDFFFSEADDVVFYSIDGETFSIPIEDIPLIDASLRK